MRISEQVLDEALHHETTVGLAWMHPRIDDGVLLLFVHGQRDFTVVILEFTELDHVVSFGVISHS